jgi:hypothetical protein
MERLKGIYDALVGNVNLPKSFRKTLEKYKDVNITKIIVKRTPLSGVVEGLLNLITLGKWKEIKGNFDKLYHLYAVLYLSNGKQLLLEKNERPVLSESIPTATKETQVLGVMMNPISLGEFIGKTVKGMSLEDYIDYDAYRNNCQIFIRAHLLYNQLVTPPLLSFIFQDTQKLIERTPSFSQWLMKKATDVAGSGRQLFEEVVYKRGGLVAGRGRGRGRGRKRFGGL